MLPVAMQALAGELRRYREPPHGVAFLSLRDKQQRPHSIAARGSYTKRVIRTLKSDAGVASEDSVMV